jgi:beta-glucanase (GH16 family)
LLLACLLTSPATARSLELDGYRLVFEDDFRTLSVSAFGPGTRWTAHTPWGGDFGDAAFSDPSPDFPFTSSPAGLRIELRKRPDGTWRSGLLASVDAAGHGFTLQYGYFEMRARLPSGPGVWPAFWLDSMPPAGSPDPSIEIDVIEQYGQFPAAYNSTVTVWPHDRTQGRSWMHINRVPAGSMSTGFHTYGVVVGPQATIFYFDRNEVWRVATPQEHRHGLMILVDLGLGGGWPTAQTPSPSYLDVDYIRAYALPAERKAE